MVGVQTCANTDISSLRDDFREDVASMRKEIAENVSALRKEVSAGNSLLRSEVRDGISLVRQEYREDAVLLRKELRASMAQVRASMAQVGEDQHKWVLTPSATANVFLKELLGEKFKDLQIQIELQHVPTPKKQKDR